MAEACHQKLMQQVKGIIYHSVMHHVPVLVVFLQQVLMQKS